MPKMVHPHPDLEGRVLDAHELQVGPFSASGWVLADKDGKPLDIEPAAVDDPGADQPAAVDQKPQGGRQQKPKE